MYWFKLKTIFPVCVVAILFASCKPEIKETGGPKYFDLKGYFKGEAARLNKLHPAISKLVDYNGEPEKKPVTIKNWEHELDLFTESDINKPAWRNSYTNFPLNNNEINYIVRDTSLRTRNIVIHLSSTIPQKVTMISITNISHNLLYKTREQLIYFPDSLYQIDKQQTVKILGTNTYQIYGKFK